MEQGINELNDTTVFSNFTRLLKPRVLFDLAQRLYAGHGECDDAHLRRCLVVLEMNVPAGQLLTYQYLIDGELRVADPFSEYIDP